MSVCLLTDRIICTTHQYSSNIGGSLFVIYGVVGIFEWLASFVPGKSCVIPGIY